MNVAIVTDSNTMIPAELIRRFGITVVPLTVVIGTDELVEDGGLDVADAYRRLRTGETATTSAPTPGAFAGAYAAVDAQDPGRPIASIHIGASYSGTINTATLGAELSRADVRLVDTGAASFLAGCCVLSAAEVAAGGGEIDDVVLAAERTANDVASVFTIAELDRANAGGRLGRHDDGDATPVLLMRGTDIEPIASVDSADDAARAMLDHVCAIDGRLRIGVGDADAGPVVDELVARLREARPDDELIRYVVGPTVAAHAGMGTFGVVFHPLKPDTPHLERRAVPSPERSAGRDIIRRSGGSPRLRGPR